MRFHVVTIFPEMIRALTEQGLVAAAVKEKRISIDVISPREFTSDFHKTVDDRPYGGGDGMILLGEPLKKAVEAIQAEKPNARVVYMSAQGTVWSDAKAKAWAEKGQDTILICGRYGGVDQRFINHFVDEEISAGDYILTGGEIPAALIIDSVARLLPGVLGNSVSAIEESFSKGQLEGPSFTRPQVLFNESVPNILLSGDHKKIEAWRSSVGLVLTFLRRRDLLGSKADVNEILEKAREIGRADLVACGVRKDELETLGL